MRALTRGEKTVVVEGDGSLIMGLSVMSTIGHLGPENLVVLVLDNGVYLATGGQPTASPSLDMCALALCPWLAQRALSLYTRGVAGESALGRGGTWPDASFG